MAPLPTKQAVHHLGQNPLAGTGQQFQLGVVMGLPVQGRVATAHPQQGEGLHPLGKLLGIQQPHQPPGAVAQQVNGAIAPFDVVVQQGDSHR